MDRHDITENIVESDVKHHNPYPLTLDSYIGLLIKKMYVIFKKLFICLIEGEWVIELVIK
jgi:hypothetical protein